VGTWTPWWLHLVCVNCDGLVTRVHNPEDFAEGWGLSIILSYISSWMVSKILMEATINICCVLRRKCNVSTVCVPWCPCNVPAVVPKFVRQERESDGFLDSLMVHKGQEAWLIRLPKIHGKAGMCVHVEGQVAADVVVSFLREAGMKTFSSSTIYVLKHGII